MCHFSQLWRGSPIYLTIVILFLNYYLSTATDLSSMTSPLFKDTPFAVIWNAPTNVCKNFKISLDFSAFQAVTTPGNKPDQFLFLFYYNKLGLYPHTNPSTEEQHNGGIPQKGDIKVSLRNASNDITQYIPNYKPGLAVIDWEEWRPQWVRNWNTKQIYQKLSIEYAKKKDPTLPLKNVVVVAKEQFHTAARSYMEETMQLGIKQRPQYLWGFYLFPDCYNYNWNDPGYTGQCTELEKTRNNELLWLWNSSTALFPSAYLPLSLKGNNKISLFVRGVVKEAIRVSALPKRNHTIPIFVYLQPLFRDQHKVYLTEIDLVRTIGESAALGAAGTVLWGASASFNNKASCEALSTYLKFTLGPHAANVTAAAKLCSNTLCQGSGRCIRKNPDSDDYLYLNSENFHIQEWKGKYMAIGVPSPNDLKVFADKFTCKCYEGQSCTASMSMSHSKTPVIIQV